MSTLKLFQLGIALPLLLTLLSFSKTHAHNSGSPSVPTVTAAHGG